MQRILSLQAPAEPNDVRQPGIRFEVIGVLLLLALLNAPLATGAWSETFAFLPARVANGEWWRIITHPFVHVSRYHLLLDGSAFLLLYTELRHWPMAPRLALVAAAVGGSLLAAMTSPLISTCGLCGLSGIAHGLMAVSAIEMIRRGERWERLCGWLAFVGLVAKTFAEAATGHVVLWFLHGASVGVPIAACHTGGVVGALLFMLLSLRTKAAFLRCSNNLRTVGNP